MGRWMVLALRAVIAVLIAGGLVIVVAMTVGLVRSDEGLGDVPAQAFFAVMIPAFVAAITILVCVWKLLTMAHNRTVFSRAAFGYVNVVIGGFTLIAVLIVAFAGLLTLVNDDMPEPDQIAPGVVLMVGGVGLAVFGVALVVLVMRALLAQAVDLQDELGGVI
jgi:hypothetical protein